MKKQTSINAAIWNFLERVSTQFVSFIIGVVLARLLSPHDYGVVGLTTIFIALSNVFIDSGFANGLIRKQDRTEKDLSTAFYFNVVVGFFVYILLCLCSPVIASFFDEPKLVFLIKIAGLNVLFNSLCIVQTAILTANLNIRLQTIINVSAQIPSGLLAIYLAYNNFGVYSLALQTVSSSFLKVLLLWYYAKWIPKENFCKESFKYLWGFGSKLLGANLIGTFFDQIYTILIGKFIGKNELGYFTKAQHLNQNVNSVSIGIVQKISLPVLAKYQNDDDLLCSKFREIMRILVFVEAGLSAYLCFAAQDIVVFLWSEKWLDSVVLFQLLIIGTMFSPIGQLSLSLMQAKGRTDMILKLELPKKTIYCFYLFIGFMYGVRGLAVCCVFISITAAIINMWATRKILTYSYIEQFIDLAKYMLVSYSVAYALHFVVRTESVITNIILLLVLFGLSYLTILCLMHDIIANKYVYNRLVSKFKLGSK